ncbi:MAG: hypothetical protein ABW204_11415 [Microbacteriaceae bacterium]|jgi:hypothetical protein
MSGQDAMIAGGAGATRADAVLPRPHNAVIGWSLAAGIAALLLLIGALLIGLVEFATGPADDPALRYAPLARLAGANLLATPLLLAAAVLALLGVIRSRRRTWATVLLALAAIALLVTAPFFVEESLQLVGVLPR